MPTSGWGSFKKPEPRGPKPSKLLMGLLNPKPTKRKKK